jgi:putative RNA 2'-phosphotransferase
MTPKRLVTVSKFLSKYLRHEPEALDLTLAPGGWVPVADLLVAAGRNGFPISREELDRVVRDNDKQRFSFDPTGTQIRANQGHSAEVDLQLDSADPPPTLFHGTAEHTLGPILRDGLKKVARHHVHLSLDAETARKVGARHGKPVVLTVDAAAMRAAGLVFYCSANGVWLTDSVPPQYLRPYAPATPEAHQ